MEWGLFWMIVLFASYQSVSVTGNDDFVTIYRMSKNGYSAQVRTEIHRQTNALGLPLRTRNGFFIDSVEGMPSLKCSPAIKDCKWIQSSNWVYSDVDVSDDADLSINIDETNYNIHGYYKTCDDYYGGCEMYCMRGSLGAPICSSSWYDANRDMSYQKNKPFGNSENSENFRILSSSTFAFAPKTRSQSWFFIPPVNATVHLNLKGFKANYGWSAKELPRNGNQNPIYFSNEDDSVSSEHAIMLTYNYDRYSWSSAQGSVEFRRSHLTLDGQHGTLQYYIHPITESICVSVIYKIKSKFVYLNLYARLENGTIIQASKLQEQQIGNWQQTRFHVELGDVSTSIRLSLEVEGNGTVIYSINGCSPYGNQDVTITNHNASLSSNIVSHANVDTIEDSDVADIDSDIDNTDSDAGEGGKCLNGGRINEGTGNCVCPAGFRGPTCEEGCGPNSYGNDCSATCSDFKWGCLGMLFCKANLSCLCAPGYKGKECDEECLDGTYGPNCMKVCGQCKNGVCDKFTGLCHSGCKSGSYPPYCVKKYKYLQQEPKVELLPVYSTTISGVTISFHSADTNGEGVTKYYQVQYYNMEASHDWVEMKPRKLNESVDIVYHNIQGLSPGREHIVRVVLFDADGGSYQGPLVPTNVFTTNCTEATSREYNMKHNLTQSGFLLQWQYTSNETDCPITEYIVTLRRKWHHLEFNTNKTEIEFQNLLGGTEYEVKVKGQTKFTFNPSSPWYVVKTSDKAPDHVRNLRAIAKGNKKLLVSWLQPYFTAGALQKYVIRYKCTQYLACSVSPENDESEEIEVTVGANETSLTLEDLSNHAVYSIEVAGVTNDFIGPFANTQSATQDSEPDTYPTESENPVVLSSNTTVTVQWLKSNDTCSLFNGYFIGYHYELMHYNNTKLKEGQISNTNITFTDLTPRTTYLVNVYILSSGGWNENKKITISASTKATVPEEVQNLIAYKRGRRQIGLRWSKPDNTFGEIKSFLVSYCAISGGCESEVTVPTDPISCSAWPDQFCYTIKDLRPNTKYSLSVRARNNEVDEYGDTVTTTAVTSEGVPQAPIGLRKLKVAHHSVTLEWKPPLMYNGILRSFLVNVEHIDSANTSNCCSYFPLQEILVKSENASFSFEVVELSPASKYTFGISSKTISIGPSATVTVNTPPEVPEFLPPQILDGSSVLIPKQNEYLGLTSKYLLVIVSEHEETEDLCDKDVTDKIREITESFYVVGEFNNSVLPATVSLDANEGPQNGTYCVIQKRALPKNFGVGLALVLDYNGSKSVKFVFADPL